MKKHPEKAHFLLCVQRLIFESCPAIKLFWGQKHYATLSSSLPITFIISACKMLWTNSTFLSNYQHFWSTGNGLSYLRVPGWFSLSILKISKTKLENQNRKITSTAMAKRGMNQRLFLSISTLITLKIPNWMHQLWKLVSYGAKYYSKYQICSSVLVVSLWHLDEYSACNWRIRTVWAHWAPRWSVRAHFRPIHQCMAQQRPALVGYQFCLSSIVVFALHLIKHASIISNNLMYYLFR